LQSHLLCLMEGFWTEHESYIFCIFSFTIDAKLYLFYLQKYIILRIIMQCYFPEQKVEEANRVF
jgi:hypothetical protein